MENSHDVFVASPLLLLVSNFLSPSFLPLSLFSCSIHTSESQQEFFRMLDEKIEKVRRVVCVYSRCPWLMGTEWGKTAGS